MFDERRVADYRLGPELGTWGTQSVYRATRSSDGERVLLVTLPVQQREEPTARARFARQLKLLTRLQGECVPRARGVVRDDTGEPWLVLERPPGTTLAHVLAETNLRTDEACTIALCVLDALSDAHAQGLVHGYISPENVVLDLDGEQLDRPWAVLLGIGAAEAGQSTPLASAEGRELAPEVRAGQPVSSYSDIFQVGALLFEMLSGRPYSGAGGEEIRRALLAKNAGTSPELVLVLEQALADQAGDRPDSAEDLAQALFSFIPIGDDTTRLPARYVCPDSWDFRAGSLPAWVIAQAPRPAADSACPEDMLVAPEFPRAPQAPRLDSLFRDVFDISSLPPPPRQRTGAPSRRTLDERENRAAAVAVSAGAGLGAALAWLSALF